VQSRKKLSIEKTLNDDIELKMEWQGPGFEKQVVPASVFYHTEK
jgi:hypothetical protein